MKLVFLTLVLNLVSFATYATVEIKCNNGVNLIATHIAISGGSYPKDGFAVNAVNRDSGRSVLLNSVSIRSTCTVTPNSLLHLECTGGPKAKIYAATFSPLSFGGGGMYSISAKTGISTYANLADVVKPSALSQGFAATCFIY